MLLVFRLNGLLLEAGDRMAAPSGQTSARWQVMGVIDDAPLTVSQIARAMGLRRQSVQRTADLLAADGVAEFLDNPADRRAKLLTLTARGRESLAPCASASCAPLPQGRCIAHVSSSVRIAHLPSPVTVNWHRICIQSAAGESHHPSSGLLGEGGQRCTPPLGLRS